MKLIEGMKQLKVIEKRMKSNAERINQYAAIVSSERPIFNTEVEQRKQVQSLIQANTDLAGEYLTLKKRVDFTNIQVRVSISKESYSISDLLQIRRVVGALMKGTYAALNDRLAEQRLIATRVSSGQTGEKPPRVERMYDETEKYGGMQKWQDLLDEIETRLEVINATTELLSL